MKNKKKGKSKQAKEPKFFKSIQNFDKDYDYDFDEGNFWLNSINIIQLVMILGRKVAN